MHPYNSPATASAATWVLPHPSRLCTLCAGQAIQLPISLTSGWQLTAGPCIPSTAVVLPINFRVYTCVPQNSDSFCGCGLTYQPGCGLTYEPETSQHVMHTLELSLHDSQKSCKY